MPLPEQEKRCYWPSVKKHSQSYSLTIYQLAWREQCTVIPLLRYVN